MANIEKLKVTVRITKEQEESFRGDMKERYPGDSEKETERCVSAALVKGLDFTSSNKEDQLSQAASLRNAGFTDLTLDPPEEVKQQGEPEPEKETPPPTTATSTEPLKKPPTDEPIILFYEGGGGSQVDESTSKPEMAEITFAGYKKEGHFDALKALHSYGVSVNDGQFLLEKLDSGEKQTILVPKFQKDEALEKLVTAGFQIEVPKPVEPEVETQVSFLTDKDMDAIVRVANQDMFASIVDEFKKIGVKIAAIPVPSYPSVDLNPVLTAISKIPVPQPVDLTALSTKISETDTKVEEIKFVLMGGNDTDGNEVKGLSDQISRRIAVAKGAAKSARKWAKAACIAAGIAILLLGYIAFFKPAPTAKIDQTAISTAVKSSVSSALDTKINATVDVNAFVQELSKNEEFKKLLTPTANAKVPGPGGSNKIMK